jgi:intracellular multiplication protein IcmL
VEKQDALVIIMSRNLFYKQMHYLALAALGLCWLVIIALSLVLMFLMKNPTPPVYFATNHVGRLINIIPLTKPNMAPEDVVAWVTNATEATYSLDYVNFRSQLQQAEKYFTPTGWAEYMKALKSSNNLVALQESKFIIIAKVVGAPQVVNQGLLSGRYAWQFKVPVLVTFQYPPFDAKSRFANALEVTMTVRRENVLDSYAGLGIVQIIGRSPTAAQPVTKSTAG